MQNIRVVFYLKLFELWNREARIKNIWRKKIGIESVVSKKKNSWSMQHAGQARPPNRRAWLTAGLPPTPPPRSPPSYRREKRPPKDSIQTSQTDQNTHTQTKTETETFLATATHQRGALRFWENSNSAWLYMLDSEVKKIIKEVQIFQQLQWNLKNDH